MSTKKKDHHDDFSKDEEYRKLLNNLKEIIEDAKAKGVDFSERADVLECRDCGAYEDFLEGERAVYDDEGEQTEHKMFIVIDVKERTYTKGDVFNSLMTYDFICPVCGMWQTAIERHEFKD